MTTNQRLFGYQYAFNHPVTIGITVAIVVLLVLAPLIIVFLARGGKSDKAQHAELMQRYRSWLILVPLMVGPILLGAAWTMLAVGLLSFLCYTEFERATGVFRERVISFTVAVGIFFLVFAQIDNWFAFFMTLFPLTTGTIAAMAILSDQPQGYIQRVALGVMGFAFFGASLGHLGYFANDAGYRPLLLTLLLTVQLNDVFAYVMGKTFGKRLFGGRKLAPQTSPNKTVAGSVGAVLLTTPLVMFLMHQVLAGTRLDQPFHLLMLGLIISVLGQLGDLMLSSIKRDLGIKDMGSVFPGHGGLLDRFDSLVLVAPGVFHYINAFTPLGEGQETQIITRFFS